MHNLAAISLVACVAACSSATQLNSPASSGQYRGGDAPHSRAADRGMLLIPAGKYVAGSTLEEREQAYQDYFVTAGHDAARTNNWFGREEDRHMATLESFRIDQTPVTNIAYAEFVADTGIAPPQIDRDRWQKQRFVQEYETQVKRFNWNSSTPPAGREDHPVVLVTWNEARSYCQWRGAVVGRSRRLPSTAEYEKAARGEQGLIYPWGNSFDASKLNSQIQGPGDTMSVGSFPAGASTYGMLGAAGNIFQWTSTPWPYRKRNITVKGSAWDDYAGVGRGASMHGRRDWVRHVLVGFRCAADVPTPD